MFKNSQILNTIMLIQYLQKVQCVWGKFRADMLKNHSYILCCDWNSSPLVNPWRTSQTNKGSNRSVCMVHVRRDETIPGFAAL